MILIIILSFLLTILAVTTKARKEADNLPFFKKITILGYIYIIVATILCILTINLQYQEETIKNERISHALSSVYLELYELRGIAYSAVRNVSTLGLEYDNSKSYEFLYRQFIEVEKEVNEQHDYISLEFLGVWESFERDGRYIKYHSSPAIQYGAFAPKAHASSVDRIADFYLMIRQLMNILENNNLIPEEEKRLSKQPALKTHYSEVLAWKDQYGAFARFKREVEQKKIK